MHAVLIAVSPGGEAYVYLPVDSQIKHLIRPSARPEDFHSLHRRTLFAASQLQMHH